MLVVLVDSLVTQLRQACRPTLTRWAFFRLSLSLEQVRRNYSTMLYVYKFTDIPFCGRTAMPSEQQLQHLEASSVVATAGDFIDGFLQWHIDGLEEIEKGKALVDAAAEALGRYIDFLRTAEQQRQNAIEQAFELLQAAGYTPAQIAAARDALNQDPTRKPEKTKTRRTR